MDDNRNRDDGRSVGTAGMRGPEGTRSGVAEGLFEESLGRLRGIGWAQSQDRGKLPDLGMLIQSSDISHKSQFNLRFAVEPDSWVMRAASWESLDEHQHAAAARKTRRCSLLSTTSTALFVVVDSLSVLFSIDQSISDKIITRRVANDHRLCI